MQIRTVQIGQIVPSSDTTMETEIPAILRACEEAHIGIGRFTSHSSRTRMKKVGSAELEAMDRDSLRCAAELLEAVAPGTSYLMSAANLADGSLADHRRPKFDVAA